ncbi:suppressor of fused domain protein [Nannocystis pusilla]|uniref:suppressor of fused domain protein n=1 Tax=Nannocystis pusilla TaxID=889268 RepID=UPI003DA5EC22
MSETMKAPGWAAIDAACQRLYARQVPHQYTSKTAYELETASPLPAITVWEGQRPAHWHYVTYGLTELFEKTSHDPNVSGFGFELTMRVPRAEGEDQPPAWPLRTLQSLGRYVLGSRKGFDTGHRADLGGPIAPGTTTELTGLVCVPDPLLGKITGPYGSLLFLQVIGVTPDELAAMERLDHEGVVHMMGEIDFHGLTDLSRESWLKNPQKAPVVRRYQLGILRD